MLYSRIPTLFFILSLPTFLMAQSSVLSLGRSYNPNGISRSIQTQKESVQFISFNTVMQKFHFADEYEKNILFAAGSRGNHTLDEHLIIPFKGECLETYLQHATLGSPEYPESTKGTYGLNSGKADATTIVRLNKSGNAILFPNSIDNLGQYGDTNRLPEEWYADSAFKALQNNYQERQEKCAIRPEIERDEPKPTLGTPEGQPSTNLVVKELKAVNSEYDEFGPMLSSDESVIYFHRKKDPGNSMTFIPENSNYRKPLHFEGLDKAVHDKLIANGLDTPENREKVLADQQQKHREFIQSERAKVLETGAARSGETVSSSQTYDCDIIRSEKLDGQFSSISRQDFPLNDWTDNFFIGISSDGKRMFTKLIEFGDEFHVPIPESAHNSFVEYEKNPNSFKPNGNSVSIEKNHNVFWVSYFMTLNNNAILCGFEGDDTHGKGDIYISFRQSNGQFEYPKNLGTDINTDKYEAEPFLAADLKTLYFTRSIRKGEKHIFVSRRLDDTWKKWSEPVALPAPINLPNVSNSTPFITANGKTLYFASNRKTGKDKDIYYVELDESLAALTTNLVKGNVVHQKQEIKDAQVEVQTLDDYLNTKKDFSYALSNTDGSFETPFRKDEEIVIKASKKGYISEVIIKENEKDTSEEIELVKLEKGNRFVLKNILFERSKSTFLNNSYPDLVNLKNVMIENPDIKIRIEGHTDFLAQPGPKKELLEDKALKLSKERANAVKNFLIENGIRSNRIVTIGYGGKKPIVSNETEEGRKKNRRVEIEVL